MNPYAKLRRQDEYTNWTRMDLLLALFDKAIERMDKAEALLRAGDAATAIPQIAKTQLIINELASGVKIDVNPEMNVNILRLYEYATTELSHGNIAGIDNARKVMKTLREGFEAIRAEANEMERTGKILPLDQLKMVAATA
jgi:flagellar secretion chaperone FliS